MVSVYSLIPLINSSFNLMPIDKLFMIWTEGSDSASKGAQNGRSPPQPLAAAARKRQMLSCVIFVCCTGFSTKSSENWNWCPSSRNQSINLEIMTSGTFWIVFILFLLFRPLTSRHISTPSFTRTQSVSKPVSVTIMTSLPSPPPSWPLSQRSRSRPLTWKLSCQWKLHR